MTRDDFKELGFDFKTTSYGYYYDNDKYIVEFSFNKNLLISVKKSEITGRKELLFNGNVKNKEEFIILLRQLGITNE